MGVPYSMRKSLARALRADKKRSDQEEKGVQAEASAAPAYRGLWFVKMPDGSKVRDSHVAIAKYTQVTLKKRAAFKEGFPEFEWATGGYTPLLAMSVDDVSAWVERELKELPNRGTLVRNLKKYKIDGEGLARMCRKASGVA